ncbi:protein Turandot M-like [Drosophila takahashii]|uniref:protein Turandot M-like n=1 Tax=Drosophila takahashii TaxID=29030 RepID=UPI001CF8F349|nr:protein Turandot M-like [Drosophila takahashii]
MNPTIFFSCLLVLTGCLLEGGNAEGDDDFTSEKQRLLHVYGDPSVDEATRYRNVDDLAKFYEKYSADLSLSQDFHARAQDTFRRYKERKAQAVQVDGVPAQGGFFVPLPDLVIVQLGVELAAEIIKLTKAS